MTKRLELKLVWSDPKSDSQSILARERELRELQNQMSDKIVQYRLEARKFLTPDQMERFGSMGGMGFGRGFGTGCGQRMGRQGLYQ
jgi:Spy/CpxP family protein refolding chaperone